MFNLKWLKKELSEFKNCWTNEGEKLIIRICREYNYSKKQCLEVIQDALWYSHEDFCRIHSKKAY